MEELFSLEPIVGGEWGPGTVISNLPRLQSGADQVPEVTYLEYEFNTWFGDDLLQCEACYIVTERLAEAIQQANISGLYFESVGISLDANLKALRTDLHVPPFKRLIPKGEVSLRNGNEVVSWSGDDVSWGIRIDYVRPDPERPELVLSIPPLYTLVVTKRCLDVLQQHNIENCEIEDLVWTR